MLLESQPQGPGVAKPGCHALLTDPLALELGGALGAGDQEPGWVSRWGCLPVPEGGLSCGVPVSCPVK